MTSCVFCDLIADGSRDLVVDEPEIAAFLDHRPVFKGHVLVVPRVHVETLPDLPLPLVVPLTTTVQRVCTAVVAGLGADGSFVAVNNVVSQSVPHLHVHVVPRRRKDGLRGFFWPRTKYDSPDEMHDYAQRIKAALPPPLDG